MSSGPPDVSAKNSTGMPGEGKAAKAKSANPSRSSMAASVDQARQPNVDLHEGNILPEQGVTEHDAMHALSQGDAKANSPSKVPNPKLSNPSKTQIPKPDGDPFEYFLMPMLEKDTTQCNAWKDEVQNILIFAGLFSAVITAFIIESYQRLQPDPNDTIVGLLAHIAEKLDNPFATNGTASVSSLISDTHFSPSRSDININIFWFISLVLSLTVALIGIITLQWLREHQRYDTSLKPKEKMAVLHMRRKSLRRWYVPEIFASLPVLLQGALVLFFAGMIEFLFALRLEVAIPVTVTISVPLIFLISTTLLPTLQLCISQYPFRLSINNDVPSPCPYKSPQSLISRHIGIRSEIVFKLLTSLVAGLYVGITQISCLIRWLFDSELPIFYTRRANLKCRLRDAYPQSIRYIRRASGDWASIDRSWLDIRTTYAVSLQMAQRDDGDLALPRTGTRSYPTLLAEAYDCTRCFHHILSRVRADADNDALYHCVANLCLEAVNGLTSHGLSLHVVDLCNAFGRLLCFEHDQLWQDSPVTAAFFEDVLFSSSGDLPSKVNVLCAASIAAWAGGWTYSYPPMEHTIQYVRHVIREEVAAPLIMKQLEIKPEKLVAMRNGEVWLPQHIDRIVSKSYSRLLSRQIHTLLDACSTMQPDSELILRPAPAKGAYGAMYAYMEVVVRSRNDHDNADTAVLFTKLCNMAVTPNLVQEKPFLVIAACIFLDVATKFGRVHRDTSKPLLNVILHACGISKSSLAYLKGWDGIDNAIDAIHKLHSPLRQAPRNPNNFSTPVTSLPKRV